MLAYRLIAIFFALVISTAHADSPKIKQLPLRDFFAIAATDQLGMAAVPSLLDIPVVVPLEYERANFKKNMPNAAYWMKPEDVASTEKTNDLPADNGYMYGTLTSNVAYSQEQDLFMGVEDAPSLARAKSSFPDLSVERYLANKHPVLLIRGSEPKSGKNLYAAYIATGVESNVALITLRPAGNKKDAGDSVWNALAMKLEKPTKAAK